MPNVQPFEVVAQDAVAVTAADSDLAGGACRSVWVGGAGNLAVKTAAGNIVVFTAVPAGTLIQLKCIQIRATSTTATNLVALY